MMYKLGKDPLFGKSCHIFYKYFSTPCAIGHQIDVNFLSIDVNPLFLRIEPKERHRPTNPSPNEQFIEYGIGQNRSSNYNERMTRDRRTTGNGEST